MKWVTPRDLDWAKVVTLFALWTTMEFPLSAQTLSTLYTFCVAGSPCTDGDGPIAGLVQATNGRLYGTTFSGGAQNGGTIFKITTGGELTTLYDFCSQGVCGMSSGEYPSAPLIQATNGDFYGTTQFGGSSASCQTTTNGCGIVFKMTPGGALTALYNFCPETPCTNGATPYNGGLVQAPNGDLYGTTLSGGANNNGTVFKITPAGTLTTIYSFCAQADCADGADPLSGLAQATNGDFYGTTQGGGARGPYGTVFKITSSGTLTTLHSFCSRSRCADGSYPYAGLVQAADGNFYGTTLQGGAYGSGTVFQITPGGRLTTLYSFCGQEAGCVDGGNPQASLIQATDGYLYGTTTSGGPYGQYGTIFKISTGGTLTTVYDFCSQPGCSDGEVPNGLVQATNGDFYGTTLNGGSNLSNAGTIFSLSVGLGPFVETQTTSGKVGAAVKILGTNLIGATTVTFNGTDAVFEVVSASEITATVPSGATTGPVQVATPSGTLSSNVPFIVR